MKKIIYLLLTCLILASCSNQKRIARFVKKVPPIEIAAYLTKENPELFKPQTLHFRDTIRDTVPVPEIKNTIEIKTICECKDTTIKNEDGIFQWKDGKLIYTLFPPDLPVAIPVDTVLISQPCPQQAVIDQIVKENKEAEFKIEKLKSEKKTLWIWLIILAAVLVVENLLLFKFKLF